MKKVKIELIASSSIILAISIISIQPFLFRSTPSLVDEEKNFKQLIQNLTSSTECLLEKNILPGLFCIPFLFNHDTFNFFNSNEVSVQKPNLSFTRLIPAILTSFVPVIFLNFLYYEGTSLRTSFLLSLILSLDSSFIIRGRLFIPDCFIYFFSITSLYFFSSALKFNSLVFYLISNVLASLSFLCDHQGLYIISFIFFRLVDLTIKQKMTFKHFYYNVLYLFSSLVVSILFTLILHIGLQSGPSDVLPIGERLIKEFGNMISFYDYVFTDGFKMSSKMSFPVIAEGIKIKPNFSLIALMIFAVFSSFYLKKFNAIAHFFIALLTSFFYKDSFVNHMQVFLIFGLIASALFFDVILKNYSRSVSCFFIVTSVIYFLYSFQSNYGVKFVFNGNAEYEL